MYKYILTAVISLSIYNNASAADEIHVIDANGDAEIYIPKQGTPNTYISSGMIAEPTERPTVKVYTPDSGMRVTSPTEITTFEPVTTAAPLTDPIPVTVTQGEYNKLIDAGGKYDASGDTYSPKIDFAK